MKDIVAVSLAVALLLAPCASAAVKAQELVIKSGAISLTVKTHDGKPLPKATVKLLGADGKVKLTVVADKNGECALKDLKPGAYKLILADRAMLPFTVSDKGKVTTLLLVLPPPPKYAAGEAKKALAMPTLTTFIIGAVAVGIGIYLIVHDGGGSHGHGGHP